MMMSTSYPVVDWMVNNTDITREQWNEMVDLASDQYLREQVTQGSTGFIPYAELLASDPIGASEVSGSVERILAATYGWKTTPSS